MKTIVYYAGFILIPVLFLMYFGSNVIRSVKNSWNNAKIQTRGDYQSHRRYFNKTV